MALEGIIAAMATPMDQDENIYLPDVRKYVDFLLKNGVEGILVGGSTGEGVRLGLSEYEDLLREVRKFADSSVTLVAGITAFDYTAAMQKVDIATRSGFDYVLIATPPYIKPNPNGIVNFYSNVAQNSDLPVIVYNVPSRTGLNLSIEVIERLMQIDNIAGLKEATEDVYKVAKIVRLANDHSVDFPVLSGTDSLNVPMFSVGARGAISVLAAIAPEIMEVVYSHMKAGNFEEAHIHQWKSLSLMDVLFIESNPVPLKAGLKLRQIISSDMVRNPLAPASQSTIDAMEAALSEAGLASV